MTSSVPAVQQAQKAAQAAEARLAAFTDVDAFSGIPALLDLLSGNINTLLADDDNAGYDALSALDVFFGDGFDAEGGVFTGGGINALANYAALSALPIFFGPDGVFGTGGIDALADYAALSALPVFFGEEGPNGDGGVFTGGGIDALSGYDALSAIPPYVHLAGGDITATGDLDSVSAVDTFFGDGSNEYNNPADPDEITGTTGPVFGPNGININALAPSSDGSGGYAALSALPVFAGTDDQAPFGLGVFTGGGVGALKNYDALSAIPAYLNATQGTDTDPPTPFRVAAPTENTLTTQTVDTTQDKKQTNLVQAFSAPAPAPEAAPADPAPADPPAALAPKSKNTQGNGNLGLFKPGTTAVIIPGFGGGGGADNGIRGWGDMLKKAGLNGGESAGADGGGASAGGGAGAGGAN
jgi:hypothetical protein